MSVSHTKVQSLADFLGYDSSYVSKWLSGKYLPSKKSADTVILSLAAFFSDTAIGQGTLDSLAGLLGLYGVKDPGEDRDLIVAAVREVLLEEYHSAAEAGDRIKSENIRNGCCYGKTEMEGLLKPPCRSGV
jgi:hypothetical protein